MIEIACAKHRQYRSENFFLRDPTRRLDVAENYRPDKKSVPRRRHFQDTLSGFLAQANILGNPISGSAVDHRAKDIARVFGRTDFEAARRADKPREQAIVNFV